MKTPAAVAIAFCLVVPMTLHGQQVDLAISLFEAQPPVAIGDDVTISFVVKNNVPDTAAHGVHVKFKPASGWISPRAYGITPSTLGDCPNLDCSFGDLAPGKSIDVRFNAHAPATPAALFVDATVVSASADAQPDNDTLRVPVPVVAWPDLFLDRLDFEPENLPEGRSHFDVSLGNTGKAVATHVVFEVKLPDGSNVAGWTGGSGIFDCDFTGPSLTCRAPALSPSDGDVTIGVRFVNPPLYDGGLVQAAVRVSANESEIETGNNSWTFSWRIPQFFSVTTTADSGPGSLRDAITRANATCQTRCAIGFRIAAPPPPSGFFTVRPETPLPKVAFLGHADTSTEITGDAEGDVQQSERSGPWAMIDGSSLADGDGLQVAPGVRVRGLSIGNCPRFGLFVDGPGVLYLPTNIERVYLGVDPTGHVAAPNLRGLVAPISPVFVDHCVISGNHRSGIVVGGSDANISDSRIGVAADSDAPMPNGASGIYLPNSTTTAYIQHNVIAFSRDAGIALSAAQHEVDISQNSIRDNGIGIDYGLNGPTPNGSDSSRPPNYPTIVDAHYDQAKNKTVITVQISSAAPPLRTPDCDGVMATQHPTYTYLVAEIYANDGPDGQAQRFLGGVSQTNSYTTSVDGDLRGQWITAVTRRTSENCFLDCCSGLRETSEISPAAPVR